MLVAHYIGDHKGDTLLARTGWYVTRRTQKGRFGYVTHTEAIHDLHPDGSVTIASASLRDKGVRPKTTYLNPEHWLIADVDEWHVQASRDLLVKTKGMQYDWRGAWATRMPGSENPDQWFCNEWVAYPYLRAAATFGPHHLAAITFSIGRDVTLDFHAERRALRLAA